jgi:hypothetical protein
MVTETCASTDYIGIMDNFYACLTVVCGCLFEFRKKGLYNVRSVLIVPRSEKRSCRMMKPECMHLIITVEERHNSGRIFKSLISARFFFCESCLWLVSLEWITIPKQVKSTGKIVTFSLSTRHDFGWNFLHSWWNSYTTVTWSSFPRLW